MEAVVFDVDGTLVDSERHGHRVAFNMAFEAFGLPYRWDELEYGRLLRTTGGQRRIDGYLAAQGVEEGERAELAPALHARKTAITNDLIAAGRIQPRPGVERLLAELSAAGVRLAVATTGSRAWVEQVLATSLGDFAFEVVVTGEEVATRKPDPEAFTAALRRLGLPAAAAVGVEDSAEGLESAKGAGLACVVVANGYTVDHDLGAADLVLDGFGELSQPATVLADPVGSGCAGVLNVATLRRVWAEAS
ncbi:MAG TPA: HAD-IA family hydrolase [Acidimicrobiales bacterium]|nr:HAD-IA family hydrolase [Acidimicrobiales bacterium]